MSLRLFLILPLFGVAFLLLMSFLGSIHPIGDSLAVFRLPLAISLAVLALLFHRHTLLTIMGVLLAFASSATVIWAYQVPATTQKHDLTIYQKNLSFKAGDRTDLLKDIQSLQPDVITLQEVHARHLPLIETLKEKYPQHIVCPFAAIGAVAVLSRLPLSTQASNCQVGLGVAALHLQGPKGSFWVTSVHQHWPWPFHQTSQAQQIIPLLFKLPGPKIIAGDFNMVPWSHNLTQYTTSTNTRIAGPYDASFMLKGSYAMRIDHVLAPKGGTTSLRPYFGSDHFGLFAHVNL